MKKLLLILLACTLTACATGTPFKWNDARKLEKGMSTAQVKAIMGNPLQVSTANGLLTYVWVSVNSLTFSNQTLRVDFKDDKAIDVPDIPADFKD